ncbi:peroxiredoxin [Alcanivorax sp. 1008]|uniref:peroxiredoxin family protein n=1 Tax=Alcanivorax sp. 1008 TaxID=2816853 RepID=UPI001E1A78BB|nr:redoxin domain-containing protein [Alcanivorax sp. 1008]MCC1496351.1 redoxin domain-containing protein [Alcanivorax sp. 1008]
MKLKSLFISLWIALLVLGVGRSGWILWQQPAQGAAWGVAVALLPALVFFMWLLVAPVARTGATLWPLTAGPLIGLLVWLLLDPVSLMPLLHILGTGLAGGLLYQFWYSRFNREQSDGLTVGQRLPSLQFAGGDGKAVRTDELTGPLLLIFYRGNWCPLCMAQIREVAGQYRELHARGVTTLLVSPQPHENTSSLAERFDVPFLFLVDEDNHVARQLGIVAENGLPAGLAMLGYDSDTVMPTVVMTNADGVIIFSDQTDNYRVRPEPDVFIRILDEAGVS